MTDPIFDWKCPECKSEDVVFWQSCSRAINKDGEGVDSEEFISGTDSEYYCERHYP